MKRKHLTETPVCPQEHLVIISYTTGLSFALKRIGPLAAIIIIVFYLLVLYILALSNTPENLFASIYSESLFKTACQHLLLLVGFDTLIYRKYYDTPPILVGHQDYFLASFLGSEALLKSGIGKCNFRCEYCFYLCLLFSFIMEKSPFGSLLGNTTAAVTVVDEPLPT
jgi:sulfatase maturation enzyme AslB (radical SAM superfamily)